MKITKESISRISTIENLFRVYKCIVANMIFRKVENILKILSTSWAINKPHIDALPLFYWVTIAYSHLQRNDWIESGRFGRVWIFCFISSFYICHFHWFLVFSSNCFFIYIEHSSRLIFSNFDLPQIHVLQACILWFFKRRKKCRKIVYFELSGW